jgi:hypothetical protein
MGSCVSVHRSSDSAMKLRLSFASKDDKLVIPPSPIKETPTNGIIINNNNNNNNNVVAVKSQQSPFRSGASFGGYGMVLINFFFLKKKIRVESLFYLIIWRKKSNGFFFFVLCIKVIVLYNISLLDFVSDVRSEMKLAWGLHICFYMVEEIILLVGWFLYLPAIP